MRDLLFRNLISADRKRKVISSCEIIEKQGMCTTIRRHFVCQAIEIKDTFGEKPLPLVRIRRICNHIHRQESLFCRMKASLYAKSNGRLFLILFGHSFKIESRPVISIQNKEGQA